MRRLMASLFRSRTWTITSCVDIWVMRMVLVEVLQCVRSRLSITVLKIPKAWRDGACWEALGIWNNIRQIPEYVLSNSPI